ncbi:MAG TPA: sigma-70 family RNA polymerase sigma factor [Pyrinomonadaceae bacterium]|jgi:RNA polymerase sigma-70 factor (ECF subfamily)
MQPAETATVEVTIEKVSPIDPSAWVDEHGDYLFRYAVVRLRDEDVAEDCVQETLLSAIQSIDSYSGRSTERTWLTGILKYKIVDHFRRSAREQPLPGNGPGDGDFDEFFQPDGRWKDHWQYDLMPVDWAISPEAAMEQTEFRSTFQRCLGKLPDRVAGVFALREMEGLDTVDVCEVLQLTSENFWVMMHRARMGLRRCMELNWFKKA